MRSVIRGCMSSCGCGSPGGNGGGGGGGGGAGGGGTGGGGAVGASRRQYWGALFLLALCCSGLYLLLYYRATLSAPSILLFQRIHSQPTSPFPHLALTPVSSGLGRRNGTASWGSSVEALREAIVNGSAPPLLTLFTSWTDRKDLSLVRNLTLWNWSQLKPFIVPVLFTNDSQLAGQAAQSGWHTLPVSRTAIGVPVLKNMYLDSMRRFNSTLYAFANGDILFTQSLVDSLVTIWNDSSLPLDNKSILVVGRRVNVPMVTAADASTFENITKVAKARGKVFTTMAEDFFITDRRFPWDSIPGVVIGRVAYDNWLVLNAIQQKQVVVDVSKTVLAVHQTTKAGNFEGFSHANASYNDHVLKRLYKRIHYMGGSVDCAPWRTLTSPDGRLYVEKVPKRPKHC